VSRLHKPRAGFWIRLCVLVIYPFAGIAFRIRWRHLDRVPPRGGVIIAINHISHVDPMLMARMVWQSGRIPRFLIKSGLFHQPGLGRIVRGARQIPVYRGTADAADSVQAAAAALDAGEAVIFYPEGTITQDPQQWPMQARTGIARLVLLRPDAPVVPIGQWGAQLRDRVGWRQRLTRRPATASVGEPLDLSRYRGSEPDAETLREITDTIMRAIRDEVAALRDETPPSRFYPPPARRIDKQPRRRFRVSHRKAG
jgi:1-acyl-sn-glycerol-3-phosphate acyltransferase